MQPGEADRGQLAGPHPSISKLGPAQYGMGFLLRRAETALVAAGWLRMMDPLLAVLSLGAVALIVAAPLYR